MKAICENEKVIERFKDRVKKLKQKIEEGEIKLTQNEGHLHKHNEFGYTTASKKGMWYVDSKSSNLIFRGRRQSFKMGSSLLNWEPKKSDGWEVMESTHDDREPFESKVEYYRRKYDEWSESYLKPREISFVSAQKSLEDVREHLEEYSRHLDRNVAVVEDKNHNQSTMLVFDERDVDLSEVASFLRAIEYKE